jgi:Cu2+-exporting ATPase
MTQLFTDKTGTLTEARPACVGMVLLPTAGGSGADSQTADDTVNATGDAQQRLRRARFRADAAGLARWSAHPLSAALVAFADTDELPPKAWTMVSEQPGCGLEAQDAEGRAWRLGSRTWGELGASGVEGREGEALSVWFGPAGEPLARFEFDEQLRPEVTSAVAELKRAGVEVAILSGDRQRRVSRLAAALGGLPALGDASPEAKLAAVASAQARGRVVGMVGDGINDAPVLARADISFAMGHGALVTRTQADAVITSGRWADLVAARRLAQRTLRTIRQNLIWAAAYNAACIPLAMLGLLPPWAAGLGMACSSLAVVCNSWRLSRWAP